MSKTERSTTSGRDRLEEAPPFAAGQSGPLGGCRGAEDEGVTCLGAGEGGITVPRFTAYPEGKTVGGGLCSEEDMVVREQEVLCFSRSLAF